MQSSSQIITTNKPTSFFLQAGCPSFRPTNSVKALKGKYHIPWTCLPQAQLGFSNFVSEPSNKGVTDIKFGHFSGILEFLSPIMCSAHGYRAILSACCVICPPVTLVLVILTFMNSFQIVFLLIKF